MWGKLETILLFANLEMYESRGIYSYDTKISVKIRKVGIAFSLLALNNSIWCQGEDNEHNSYI